MLSSTNAQHPSAGRKINWHRDNRCDHSFLYRAHHPPFHHTHTLQHEGAQHYQENLVTTHGRQQPTLPFIRCEQQCASQRCDETPSRKKQARFHQAGSTNQLPSVQKQVHTTPSQPRPDPSPISSMFTATTSYQTCCPARASSANCFLSEYPIDNPRHPPPPPSLSAHHRRQNEFARRGRTQQEGTVPK